MSLVAGIRSSSVSVCSSFGVAASDDDLWRGEESEKWYGGYWLCSIGVLDGCMQNKRKQSCASTCTLIN